MKDNDNTNMYEGLALFFLPTGVLEYFQVTDFAETPTKDKDVLYFSGTQVRDIRKISLFF